MKISPCLSGEGMVNECYTRYTSNWVLRKPVFGGLQNHRRRPACASAQSDQHLCYSLFGNYI